MVPSPSAAPPLEGDRPRRASSRMAATSAETPRLPMTVTTAAHVAVTNRKTKRMLPAPNRDTQPGSESAMTASTNGGRAAATISRKSRTVGRLRSISGGAGASLGPHPLRGAEPVADTALGEQVARMVRIELHLPSEAADGHPHVRGVGAVGLRPDALEQGLGGDRAVERGDHHLEEAHLYGGQRLGAGRCRDAALDEVDLQLTAVEGDGCPPGGRAPQHALDPGDQLVGIERL